MRPLLTAYREVWIYQFQHNIDTHFRSATVFYNFIRIVTKYDYYYYAPLLLKKTINL